MGFQNLIMPAPSAFGRRLRGAAATALAAGLAVLPLSAQSLGELAKMEEERRKAIKSSGKVYTNESIRPAPRSQQPPPAAEPAAPSAGSPAPPPSPSGVQAPSPSGVQLAGAQPAGDAAPPPPAAAEPRDEAYWKGRIQAARDAVQRAEIFADALQSRINALSADFVARDDPAQRGVIATDRQKALAELDRVHQEIQDHTKSIAAIQDEARRAGVPPGWLR